jgi:hypothetical protein
MTAVLNRPILSPTSLGTYDVRFRGGAFVDMTPSVSIIELTATLGWKPSDACRFVGGLLVARPVAYRLRHRLMLSAQRIVRYRGR